MTVVQRDGKWWVVSGKDDVAGPFATNAEAFRWFDRNDAKAITDENRRLRIASSFADF